MLIVCIPEPVMKEHMGIYTNLSQMHHHPSFEDLVNNPVHNDQSNANNDNQ